MYNSSSGSHRSHSAWNPPMNSSYRNPDQNFAKISHSVGNTRSYSPDQYGNTYPPAPSISSKTIHGYVTRLHDSWGVIENDIQFSFSTCSRGIPKMNEYVIVEASHSPNSPFKWKATKVQLCNNGRDYSNTRTLPNSRNESDPRGRGSIRGKEHSRDRSRDRRYDESDRKRFKRDDRRDRSRDVEKEQHRERDRQRDHERSPTRRSKSPNKRKYIRYGVRVPSESLSILQADTMALKKRYPALYIPSDFCISRFSWTQTLPLAQPYTLDKPCNFHIMNKDCRASTPNDAVYDPPDLDYLFSVKVMLMGAPHLHEIYKKTLSLAEESHKEEKKALTHVSRLVEFLVASRSKGEPMAIGGAWSPSLDGENPKANPRVLIRTAVRTCKALTGIDLSSCLRWYRFMEVHYHRSESVHKEKTIPARVETVVFFLPEVWNCAPSFREWDTTVEEYKRILQESLQPKLDQDGAVQTFPVEQAEESDKEEDLVVIDKCEDRLEPTHYSELDPENMKVNDLRQELEARSLSTKGLKPQLIQRLDLALRKEKDAEAESSDSSFLSKFMKDQNEIKLDPNLKVVDEVKMNEDVKEGENNEMKVDVPKNDEFPKVDRATLEKWYTLPSTPHIIVHPSRSAKSGKFHCHMMSLAALLDYGSGDFKENSFELGLFAESFHKMLQRDFGYIIFKALCKHRQEKAKEEKNEKEQKKNGKDPKQESTEDEKAENVDEDENMKESKEKSNIIEEAKSEEKKNEERVKMVTVDPTLLLSFMFFDRSQCGYIMDKDLENLILSIGLNLSRHQVRRLITKVSTKDIILYRKITDKPENEKDNRTEEVDLKDIITGNEKYFPVFEDDKNRRRSSALSNERIDKGDVYGNVESITAALRRSETGRLEAEEQLLKYKNENESLKESLKRLSDKEKKVHEDLRACRDKVVSTNQERIAVTNKSKSYYKTLMSIKELIRDVEVREKPPKKKSSSDKCTEKSTSSSRGKGSGNESGSNEKSDHKDDSFVVNIETKNVEDVTEAKMEETTEEQSTEVEVRNDSSIDDSMDA